MRKSLFAFALAACVPVGCGSVLNHTHSAHAGPTEQVYGGVLLDAQMATESATSLARGQVKNPREFAAAVFLGAMCVVDLPMSLIADTLWLPHDIHAKQEKATQAGKTPVELPLETAIKAEN